MDIDPLADTVPPRHAVESDDEEDEYNPISASESQPTDEVDIKIVGDLTGKTSKDLIVAIGDAGRIWVKGVKLGEQAAAVMVNHIQVGLLFSPVWTGANVLVSEVTTRRLPVWAMHRYAEVTLDSLSPSSVTLLDTYAVPAYITPDAVPAYEAPIRYLRTKGSLTSTAKLQRFSPPNLIQSTSASFMSILAFSTKLVTGTLFLLPSPYIPPPPPGTIGSTDISLISTDDSDSIGGRVWCMKDVQEMVSAAVGEKAPSGSMNGGWSWSESRDKNRSSEPRASMKRGDVGEGGMYI